MNDNVNLLIEPDKLFYEIIFVTEPGDGQGGIAKPNWEGDCSVITLKNLTPEELELNPWRLKAIERPFVDCIPYVQDRQNEWSEEKYQQVIDSIKMKGEEDLFIYNNKTNKVFKFLLQEVDSSIVPPKKI